MQKFYIAHAMILDENNHITSFVYCGAFYNRCNAYKNIKNVMDTCKDVSYIPSVKLGEILDAESDNVWDWVMTDLDLMTDIECIEPE